MRATAVDAADTRMVLRYQRPNGWLLNRPVNCSRVQGVGHRSLVRMTTWVSDLNAVTAIQYSGPSTNASSPASANQDPTLVTRADARRPPRFSSTETTRPTATTISRISPRTTAAFQKICGDAQ